MSIRPPALRTQRSPVSGSSRRGTPAAGFSLTVSVRSVPHVRPVPPDTPAFENRRRSPKLPAQGSAPRTGGSRRLHPERWQTPDVGLGGSLSLGNWSYRAMQAGFGLMVISTISRPVVIWSADPGRSDPSGHLLVHSSDPFPDAVDAFESRDANRYVRLMKTLVVLEATGEALTLLGAGGAAAL